MEINSKAKTKLMEYMQDLNLKNDKKYPKSDDAGYYADFTAPEAAVISKLRTLKMHPKQQYYPSYIKEFTDNELTQFICDLIKYGNEKIDWDKVVHANEQGAKYREKEIERKTREKINIIQRQKKKLLEEEDKLRQELGNRKKE